MKENQREFPAKAVQLRARSRTGQRRKPYSSECEAVRDSCHMVFVPHSSFKVSNGRIHLCIKSSGLTRHSLSILSASIQPRNSGIGIGFSLSTFYTLKGHLTGGMKEAGSGKSVDGMGDFCNFERMKAVVGISL